ncbi:Metallo-dependent hydrolase [Coniochaeta ligniaria NRRL 30616]|uniref:Metallo-dependent hydrolase n=1 Tax=Coniochaeta ligniaria NRRL 30616 TaxID=1408157 RepID=A0A1J7IYF5_9PEZI|nr:Metallo-dependent hydrolase [Coniochaeta ligniaria NRRL 30616]
MCQDHHENTNHTPPRQDEDNNLEPFPWDIGIFDAHCHPTDTMSSVASIPTMSARVLTVMSTRADDQDLVPALASSHGIPSVEALTSPTTHAILPAFGWHPWFSHHLYDDSLPASSATYPASLSPSEAKLAHYKSVLTPSPEEDDAFISSLPDPLPLSTYLPQLRSRLESHPLSLVGEVGLDKGFRLPVPWSEPALSSRDAGLTPGGREGRWLSPYRVALPHQTAILVAQLRVAGELGRACSVHGVQAHGALFDALSGMWKGFEKEVVPRRKQKLVAEGAEDWGDDEGEEEGGERTREGRLVVAARPYPPRICLHSFSGPVQVVRQYLHASIPARIFFSFSVAINLATEGGASKFPDVVRACPDDRILVESDLHVAGERMDGMLEEMYRRICEIKGWGLRDGVERIARNYEEFVFG